MPTDLAETADCLCLASRRAARAITRKFDRAFRPQGLRATQFTLLASLELKGAQPIGVLADFIGVERTTLTRNLAIAEKKGLVTMEPGKDARSHIVSITALGRRRVKRAFAAWRAMQDDLTDSVGTAAADGLRKLSRAPSMRSASRENAT